MKPRYLALGLLLLVLVLPQLHAGGAVEFKETPATVAGVYNYETELVLGESVTVQRNTSGSRDYFVVVSAGSSGDPRNRTLSDGSGNSIDYQFMDSATERNIILSYTEAETDADVLEGTVPGNGEDTQSFDVVVPAGQFPPPGEYQDSVSMSLYNGTVASKSFFDFQDSGSTTVSVSVPSFVELYLLDPGAPPEAGQAAYSLDFGALSPGQTQSVELLVRSNESFSVSVQSANEGSLALQEGGGGVIPYQLSVGGSPVDIGGGAAVPVLSSAGPTDLAGRRYPIGVEIGNFGFVPNGVYQDNVTFVITAQ